MKIIVTGGAGFIGSHVSEFYARQGHEVVVFDNLSRFELLHSKKKSSLNWEYLGKLKGIRRIKADTRDFDELVKQTKGADAIAHIAGQTAVTTSVTDPREDFSVNVQGTFNVLEAARKNDIRSVFFTSTNKVYGDNVNTASLEEKKTRYRFSGKYENGIPEDFQIDGTKHTPYGCSKLAADLYVQEYGRLYGIQTGVFRMSCIYGTRQFGMEDQGWLAWFAIAALTKKPVTIYGDGKQVRDVLYVSDLISLFDLFLKSKEKQTLLNIGGGSKNTISLLELIELLEKKLKTKMKISYGNWRPSDQKVYISDISRAKKMLKWQPKITPEHGIDEMIDWMQKNQRLLQ